MALTPFQRTICRVLAQARVADGESYVALNEVTGAARVSRDIDLFHDTEQAVDAAWQSDRTRFESQGWSVRVLRERPGLVEAEVHGSTDVVRLEWARPTRCWRSWAVSKFAIGWT